MQDSVFQQLQTLFQALETTPDPKYGGVMLDHTCSCHLGDDPHADAQRGQGKDHWPSARCSSAARASPTARSARPAKPGSLPLNLTTGAVPARTSSP